MPPDLSSTERSDVEIHPISAATACDGTGPSLWNTPMGHNGEIEVMGLTHNRGTRR